MKKLSPTYILVALTLLIAWGCNNEVWDSVPPKIGRFLNQYYPNAELTSCDKTGSDWRVRIKDGPGLTFDASLEWIVIAGYGETIPQALLFDQLPPALYGYLEETQVLNGVYSLERDKERYIVGLQNTSVVYDIDNGDIRSPVPPQ